MKISTKFTRQDARGFAHYVIPMLIVGLVAIVGTFLLVASHAATLTAAQIYPSVSAVPSVKGHKNGSGHNTWCSDSIDVIYTVRTAVKVDKVSVEVHREHFAIGDQVDRYPLYRKDPKNSKLWTGVVSNTVCVAYGGLRANITRQTYGEKHGADKVSVVSGSRTVKKTVPNRYVVIRQQ